jgi:capsular exopolysaccharide synthesis family protein
LTDSSPICIRSKRAAPKTCNRSSISTLPLAAEGGWLRRHFRLGGAAGLTSLLVGKAKLADVLQTHEASGLDFIASGPVPPNPAELLQSNAMADVLRDLRALYDFVAIDAPPLLPVTDAALIAAKADGALLVVRHGRSTRDQVRHSIERLTQVDASLEGVVLNMVPARTRGYGYGYGRGTATGPISRMAENGMGCALKALAGYVSGRTEITP